MSDSVQKTAERPEKVRLWNRGFVLIIFINFLVFMNHLMILSTFPFYIEYLGGSNTVAGLATAGFSIIAILLRPVIGWLLDTGRRRGVLLAGLVLMALMPLGYLFLAVLYLAFICRMLHGAALALSNTSTATVATDIIPKERFAEGMGYFGLATAMATAVAPAFGLALMNKVGYGALFIAAFLCAAVSIVLLLCMHVPKPQRVERKFSLKGMIDRDALPASVTALSFLFTYGALENFVAKYAANANLPSGGLFFTVMAVFLLLTRLTAGRVTDRHGEGIFVYSCNFAMMAAVLLLGLVPGKATFFLAAVLAGFGFGGLEPALQSMAVAIAPPERRGAANSTFLCAYDIGIGLGGAVAGVLIDAVGYGHMYTIMAVFNVISVLFYTFVGRNHPSSFSYRLRHGDIPQAK